MNTISNDEINKNSNDLPNKKKNLSKKENENLFKKLKERWPLSKVSGRIFLIYLGFVLVGGFLLSIPNFSLTESGEKVAGWDIIAGIFIASSAFSDTGIVVLDPSHDYTLMGQVIVVILIEVGGIGVLTFKIILLMSINRKISLNDTVVAQSERGNSIRSNTIELIKDGFIWISIVQIIAAVFLFFFFFFQEPGTMSDTSGQWVDGVWKGDDLGTVSPYHNFGKSLWYSIFHSTSAINNAGFDVLSSNSLQPYNVNGHETYTIQMVFLLEWVVGGLGYPTFHDIKKKIKARKTGEVVKFSLFTKLNFYVYTTLFILGPLAVMGSEMVNMDTSAIFNDIKVSAIDGQEIVYEQKDGFAVFMDILFNTSAARNSGFSSVSVAGFNDSSKIILSVLMFIGSAPSSTAGGIRTTTFAILLLATAAVIRNRNHVSVFKKQIPDATVKRSFAVLFLSIILIVVAVTSIYMDSYDVLQESNLPSPTIQLLLLVASAFGTVGFSPYASTELMDFGAFSKIMLIIVMFMGQLGISNALLIFIKPSRNMPYKYLEEDVLIG